MIVAETRKYLNSFDQIFRGRLKFIQEHEVLGIIAVTDSVEDVILSHLFLPQGNCFLEIIQKLPIACTRKYLGKLFIGGSE
jgi:hypothetical protein